MAYKKTHDDGTWCTFNDKDSFHSEGANPAIYSASDQRWQDNGRDHREGGPDWISMSGKKVRRSSHSINNKTLKGRLLLW